LDQKFDRIFRLASRPGDGEICCYKFTHILTEKLLKISGQKMQFAANP